MGRPGEFGGDYAEALFELGEVPAFAAKDGARFVSGMTMGVALAGDGLDEVDFPVAVEAEDGDVRPWAASDGEEMSWRIMCLLLRATLTCWRVRKAVLIQATNRMVLQCAKNRERG